ncbi:DUF1648 domain-containing protein [Chitinophaga sp. sic0106]|uniref:DUF1648 domain-containing protein n=1 Tax=Chitinophaga sp. sic0106 TaxID=2854785 RepID=UPI001C46501B|nr:DUF1648 domain-containing protein [Chitinophaga sp. sic0106]MBV7529718.1 DUF1648 domain-containing protein [Chitinophaga sp. sic0106]
MSVNRIKLFFFPDPQKKNFVFITKLTISLLAILLLEFIIAWIYLPNNIPIHFNLRGETDYYGDKSSLWVLLIVPVTIFLCASALLQSNLISHSFKHEAHPVGKHMAEESKLMLYIVRAAVVFVFCVLAAITYWQGQQTIS